MVKQFEATVHDTYVVKLKDWRWAKRRKEIMERDGYICKVEGCNSTEYLQVHHKHYIQGAMPWEAPDEHLITVCTSCHELIHARYDHKDLSTRKARKQAEYPLRKYEKNGWWFIDPVEPPKPVKVGVKSPLPYTPKKRKKKNRLSRKERSIKEFYESKYTPEDLEYMKSINGYLPWELHKKPFGGHLYIKRRHPDTNNLSKNELKKLGHLTSMPNT